jgi:hypothetical protein
MQIVLIFIFASILIFHIFRVSSVWQRSFPSATPGSDFAELVEKTSRDEEFGRFAIGFTSKASQFVSAITIICLYFFWQWCSSIERIVCLGWGLLELTSIAISEQWVKMGLKFPGKDKPLYLLYLGRIRNTIAIASILLFGALRLL